MTINSGGEKIFAEEVEAAIVAAREAVKSENLETIKGALETLSQSAMKIGEAIYGAQAKAGGPPETEPGAQSSSGSSSKTGSGDKVVDADFEEVKDDKKKSA